MFLRGLSDIYQYNTLKDKWDPDYDLPPFPGGYGSIFGTFERKKINEILLKKV